MPTVPRILQIAPVCGYLSSIDVGKSKAYAGDFLDPRTPSWIFYVYKILNKIYTEDNNYDGVTGVANYLYALCSPWYFEAEVIVDGGGGGQIPGVTPGNPSVNPLDFIVSATSIIATGESSIYFDGTGGNPDFRGLDVNFARGATVQYTTNPGTGELYYGWNKVTGFFQLLGTSAEAAVGERFRIMPDTASASSSSATAVAPSVTVLPGQWLNATTLNLQYIVDAGEVALFISGYNSNFLIAPTDFTYTSTGIIMTDSSFNSANFPFTLIMKIN